MDFDVIIVGGGPAGCSAALVLGRCLRRVLVIDAGRPRNAASHALHAFVSRDGTHPAEFLRAARADALKYPTVQWRDGVVADASCQPGGGFAVVLQDGARLTACKLLLATGVIDEVPALAGIERFYGRSVHHCPYCDAFEHRDEALAVYGRGEKGVGLAVMLGLWSPDVVLFTDGDDAEARAARERLDANGVVLEEGPVAGLDGEDGRLGGVVLRDGRRIARDAMFFATGRHQRSPLPEMLGCRIDHGAVATDRPLEETSVPGVYVAGDASKDLLLVVVAASEGARAAFAINRALCHDEGRR